MTKRKFLDTVFALAPTEANAIMNAFDEYVESAQLGTNLAEVGTDCISRQAAIDALNVGAELLRRVLDDADIVGSEREKFEWWLGLVEAYISDMKDLPSVQPERTCVNCGRTVNNGGWYADGGTRCPIEEHYALPKDGYCHLWEKRNVTDDDYPERRTDGRSNQQTGSNKCD